MNAWFLVASIENWLYIALSVVAVVLELWALGDCLTRSGEQFQRAGLKQKSFWLILTGIAAVVGVLTLLGSVGSLGAGFGLFQIAALCVAGVYLAGPRGEMRLYGRGGPSHYGY